MARLSNASINLHKELVYSHNIVALLEKYGVPKHLDYVSIDVDSTDIWLVEALLRSTESKRWGREATSVAASAAPIRN